MGLLPFMILSPIASSMNVMNIRINAVSYTHLDVYKRQVIMRGGHQKRKYGTTFKGKIIAPARMTLTDNDALIDIM